MAAVKPFRALRPAPDLAARVCELPYDVLSSEEARTIAAGNPLSFFHVSKPEIDLPAGTNLCAPEVYGKAAENFSWLIAQGTLRQDAENCFYLYRQVMGKHSQRGLVAVFSCQEYLNGFIKKHEFTRPDKEEDRLNHIEALNAQTGPAFLVYRAVPQLDDLFQGASKEKPEIDLTAADGIRHSAWTIRNSGAISKIEETFGKVPVLYIADGHHRSAAAARVFERRKGAGKSGLFLAVLFPHNAVRILSYNRVLKDLKGATPAELMEKLKGVFVIEKAESPEPARTHEVGFFLEGHWWRLTFKPQFLAAKEAVNRLDAALLQQHVLQPIFCISDPRTSKRIDFVGGIRGISELEKLVKSGEYSCAFAMYPASIEDLMAVADAGEVMPPKSTWFEPKLRDGMFCHLI